MRTSSLAPPDAGLPSSSQCGLLCPWGVGRWLRGQGEVRKSCWMKVGQVGWGVIAPQAWLLVLGARKLGLESLPTPLTASPLPPMASTHSHPHPSHRPPHPSQAWLSGERSSPSPGTMVKPRARGLRSRAQRSRVCFRPCHLTPTPPSWDPTSWLWDGSDSGQQPSQRPVCTWASCLGCFLA